VADSWIDRLVSGSSAVQPFEFCREIERYLCRKNDGHLIRVTGPSFDLVTGWAMRGVPLKIAFQGIDRYFERYYRKGPRRRPVKIDFCEADVLDVFDEWTRATGISRRSLVASRGSESPVDQSEPIPDQSTADSTAVVDRPRQSVRAHLKRVLMRLSSARVDGTLGEDADDLIDRVSRELDALARDRGFRGEARRGLIERLATLDRELIVLARRALDAATLRRLGCEADEELAAFRSTMAADAFGRARDNAIDRLVRERSRLPTIAFD
jgi:hypothetical protein